jgi:uncharacterized membrane protein
MAEGNDNARLEAFCDGVFAIAITLLVIDVKLPSAVEINSTADFWHALQHTAPSIVAFVLSFVVILITWVNHHAFMKLVHRSSSSFMYANGFLLMTVAFFPFPTSLLGEHVLTDHAAPAVVLYNAVASVQGLSWIFLGGAALKNGLARNDKATEQLKVGRKNGVFAFFVYALLAVLAVWFPLTIAIITGLTWVFWLIFGIRIKRE